MQKTIIDISWPLIEGMTTYKNRPDFKVEQKKVWDTHEAREASITLHLHTGTHIDAPAHFLAEGKTIESLPLAQLCGPALVLDMTHITEVITHKDLAHKKLAERVLFKTKNSLLDPHAAFNPNFIYLDHSAAQYLVEQNVRLVGIDYLGIERNQPRHETHTILLQAENIILEGCRLHNVQEGLYELICLPLALRGLEAAPARAILLQQT